MYWEKEGAFTAEISAEMVLGAGCKWVILGHSERRQYFGETDDTVNRRLKVALEAGLAPIVCVGEVKEEREAGHHGGRVAAAVHASFCRHQHAQGSQAGRGL